MMQREKSLLLLLAYLLHVCSVLMDTEFATVPEKDSSIVYQNEDIPDVASITEDTHSTLWKLATTDYVTTSETTIGTTTADTKEGVTTFATLDAVKTAETTHVGTTFETTIGTTTSETTDGVTTFATLDAVKTAETTDGGTTSETTDGVTTFATLDAVKTAETTDGGTTSETTDGVTTFATSDAVTTFQSSFHILTLRTEARQGTYSFQLEYASQRGLIVRVAEKTFSGFVDILKDNDFRNIFADGQGVVSATSATPRYEVLFESSDRRWQSKVFINVKNTTQLGVKPLLLHTNTENEIVFNKGEAMELKVRTAKRNESRHPFDSGLVFGMYSFSRDNNNSAFDAGSNFPGIIEKTHTKEFIDYDEHTLIINRDGKDYEGAVYVGMYMHTRGTIEAYGNEQTITVRLAQHRNPYPEGSLAFLRVKQIPWNSFCIEGRTCATLSVIVGNDPEDITLWKGRTDGRQEMMVVPSHEYKYQYVFMKRFYLSNISISEAGVYFYRGTDSAGNMVEKDFELNVVAL